jgi:hypothetical protein
MTILPFDHIIIPQYQNTALLSDPICDAPSVTKTRGEMALDSMSDTSQGVYVLPYVPLRVDFSDLK